MSCRERLLKFLGVVAAPGSPIAAAFGGSEAAQQQLMQVFTKARQEAQEQPLSTAEKLLNQARTQALFARFTKAGIEIPSHSRSGLPKIDAQAGYSALLQAIKDAEGQFSFTHGEFAERDVLQRALDMANEQKPEKKAKKTKKDPRIPDMSGVDFAAFRQGRLVVRNTFTPREDVERGWSGWMGDGWASQEEAIASLVDSNDITVEPQWFGLRHRDIIERFGGDFTWQDVLQASELEEDEFYRVVAQRSDADIRYNRAWDRWQLVHHEGLSCYSLDIDGENYTSVEDMVAAGLNEADAGKAEDRFQWFGFGDQTSGKVSYVCPVSGDLHLFWCEETWRENDT